MIWVWTKRWLLMVVAIPVVAWALDQVATRLEESRGETDVTRGMHGVAGRIRELRDGRGRRGRRGRKGRRQAARSRTA